MMMTPKKKAKVGAPNKPKNEKKNPNGLSNEMMEWIRKEATGRKLYSADIIREGMEFYRTAVETQRGDAETGKLFDDVLTESKTKNKEK